MILFFDKFSDIPLRGIMDLDGTRFAFVAECLDDDGVDLSDLPGVYAKIVGFECDDELVSLFVAKDRIFREWRHQFDAGLVDRSTHPLYRNEQYQQISAQIDNVFQHFRKPLCEKHGLMRVEAEQYVFQPLESGAATEVAVPCEHGLKIK